MEAKVSNILPFTPHLPLLPCLAITELVLMKEMSYLGFLFNAVQQNHSSLLLHAQRAGLGPLLPCTGHMVIEMLVQEDLFAVLDKREGCICSCHCCYLRSRELKSHVAICVHAVPIVILRIHVQAWSR